MNTRPLICTFGAVGVLAVAMMQAAPTLVRVVPPVVTARVAHPAHTALSVAITNTTTAPFAFRFVSYDCPCLFVTNAAVNGRDVLHSSVQLQPGDVLDIAFRYDGRYYSLPKVLPLFFHFEKLVPAVQIVRLDMAIGTEVVPLPELPVYIVPQGFTGVLGSIALSVSNPSVRVTGVRCTLPELAAACDPTTRAVRVSLTAPVPSNTTARIELALEGTPQPMLSIYVKEIKLIPDLAIEPSVMDFGLVDKPGELRGKEVIISSRTDRPWKILSMRAEGVLASVLRFKSLPQTNAAANTVWAIVQGTVTPGALMGDIVLQTDHPYARETRIPVRVHVTNPSRSVAP